MTCRACPHVLVLALALGAASPARGETLWIHEELPPDDGGFGDFVASAGDVDGNGAVDVFVLDAWGSATGLSHRILVFHGSCDGTFASAPSWFHEADEEQSGYYFGRLAGGADFNGDGFSDLWAYERDWWDPDACQPETDPSHCNQGRVTVWYGSPSGLSPFVSWEFASAPDDQRGALTWATVGDANDDGHPDLVIDEGGWCPGACADPPLEQVGRTLIFHGGPTGLPPEPSRTLVGNPSLTFQVRSVPGDVDGTGGTDLVGRAFLGGVGTSRDLAVFDGSDGTEPSWVIPLSMADPNGTWDVAGLRDATGDGLADLLVGVDGTVGQADTLHFLEGGAGGPVEIWSRPAPCLGGGNDSPRVRPAGDVTGDGLSDAFAATCDGLGRRRWETHAGGPSGLSQNGAVVPFEIDACGLQQYFSMESVAGLGDVDDDSVEDLLIGVGFAGQTFGSDPYNDCQDRVRVDRGEPSGVAQPACNESVCNDGLDGDGDTLVDCADPDCLGTGGCPEHEGACFNAVDDDADGLVDCDDPDCDGEEFCIPEDCSNGADDDGDGDVDCDDDDCDEDPACHELDCGNGVDDDGDGLTDCDDDDCDEDPACHELNCANGLDDDGDGEIDCLDREDCATDPACGEGDCTDGADGDGDLLVDCADPDCAEVAACEGIEEENPAQNGPEECAALGFADPCRCLQGADVAWNGNLEGGAQVLLHSGQEQLDVTDLVVAGRDGVVDVVIKRRHLTRVNQEMSPFGPAWAFNYRHYLVQETDGDFLHHGFGRRDLFEYVGGLAWEGTEGRYDRITWDDANGTATLRTRSGVELLFEGTGWPGRFIGVLTQVLSPDGNALNLEYSQGIGEGDPREERIERIIDSYGRAFTFSYPTASSTLVSSITDPDGRTVVYTYDAEARLEDVRSPTVTSTGGINDFPSGRTWAYHYRGATGNPNADATGLLTNALTRVVAPEQFAASGRNGPSRLAWTYEESLTGTQPFAYVVTHEVGNQALADLDERAGGTFTYAYEPLTGGTTAMRTTVVNRRATQTVFELTRLGQLASESVVNTRRPGGSATYQRQFTYDDDGDLTHEVFPAGNTTTRAHPDPEQHPRAMHGNEESIRAVPDTARGGAQASIEARVVYEPIFNLKYEVVDPRGVASGNLAAYTTTYIYDYMEDLAAAKSHFAPRLGLTAAELQELFDEAGITEQGDANADGSRSQRAGNVVRIEYPDVTSPSPQVAFETFAYNGFGQLVEHLDAEANVTTYEYYPTSQPAGGEGTPIGTGGYLRRVVRDARAGAGRDGGHDPTPVEQTVTYEYTAQGAFPANARGIPTAVIDGRGVEHRFLVNELDEVVKVVRAANVSGSTEPGLTAHAYEETLIRDHDGNVIERRVEDRDGLDGPGAPIVTTFEYDILDGLVRMVEDVGGLEVVTTWDRDPNGNVTDVVRAAGSPAEQRDAWTWDDRDLPLSLVRGVSDVDATFMFGVDANGNIDQLVDAEGGDVTRWLHDGYDRLREIVNREGERVVLVHDATSNVVTRQWLGPLDETASPERLLAQADATYDERGRPWRRQVHRLDYGSSTPSTLELLTTTWELDRKGRVAFHEDPDGDRTEYRHDGLDRVISVIDPLGNEAQREYDPNGNLTLFRSVERSPLVPADEAFDTVLAYDALDRLAERTEPNGQVTAYQYDSRDNVVRTVDALGNEVESRQDRLDRILTTTTYLSADGTGASAANRDPLQGGGDGAITITRAWDEAHRLRQLVDDNGNATTYTHDDLDRLVAILHGDGTTESFTYDDDSQLLTRTRQNGALETWAHDAEGRRTALSVALGSSGAVGTTAKTWGWDGKGRLVASSDDNGPRQDVSTRTTWDSLSRVVGESQTVGGLPTLGVGIEWEGTRRLAAHVYPDGRRVERVHDALDRVALIREVTPPGLIAQYEYVGRRVVRLTEGNGTVVDKRDPTTGQTTTGPLAGYDANGRTVRQAWVDPLGAELVTFLTQWDGPGGVGTSHRTGEVRMDLGGLLPGHDDDYGLDSAYRQLSFVRDGTQLSVRSLDGANKARAFFDQGQDRLPVVDGDPGHAGLNQYSSMDGLPRSYTESGSLQDDGLRTYLYDSSNRLVEVRDAGTGATVVEHVYCADGRRALTTEGEGTTRFLYSGWQVLEERDATTDAVLRQHVTGLGLDDHVQLRDVGSGADFYFHANAQGTPALLTDAGGAPAESYEHSWLGQPDVTDLRGGTVVTGLDESAVGNPYLFQGRRWSAATGLYHFRHRDYSPGVGEFPTVDPLGVWQHGMGNGYDAFGANPWDHRDPYGLLGPFLGLVTWVEPALDDLSVAYDGEGANFALGALDEGLSELVVQQAEVSLGPVVSVLEGTRWRLPDKPLAGLGVYDPESVGAEGGEAAVRAAAWVCAMKALARAGKNGAEAGLRQLRRLRPAADDAAGAARGALPRSVGSMANPRSPGGRLVTDHARDSLERHGFTSLSQVDDIMDGADLITSQADGAGVFLQKVGRGRRARYNLIVDGEEGVVTGMQNLTRSEVRALSQNYEWADAPF